MRAQYLTLIPTNESVGLCLAPRWRRERAEKMLWGERRMLAPVLRSDHSWLNRSDPKLLLALKLTSRLVHSRSKMNFEMP